MSEKLDRNLEIEAILFKLQLLWKNYPALSFSKLISNLIGTDVFIPDEQFLQTLNTAGDLSLCHFCQKPYCQCKL